jgi:hypothetical protein
MLMTMDLWYDLAAREAPDGDEAVIEKLHGRDALEPAEEKPEPPAEALDFF